MLTKLELYLFDTQGFVLLPGLCADLVDGLRNEIGPALRPDPDQAATASCRDIVDRSPLARRLAADPAIVERVRVLVNQPLRLIEAYAVQRAAGSRLPLHNGWSEPIPSLPGGPARNLSQLHTYHDGKLYCMFVKALVYLADIEADPDAPFCYVPGSHKANFPLLPLLHGQSSPEHTIADRGFPFLATQFVRAGDVLLLNEALTHGTLAKHSNRDRMFLALSYAPSFVADWRPFGQGDPVVGASPGHYEAYEGELW